MMIAATITEVLLTIHDFFAKVSQKRNKDSDVTAAIYLLEERLLTRGQVTLYIDKVCYKQLQQLVKPKKISHEVDDLIKARIFKLKDETVEHADSIDYEALKKEQFNLLKKIEKLASRLKKRKTYDELEDIAYDSGLEWDGKTMNNRDKASKGVLKNWPGPREDAHTYLSFLEAVERKSEIERLLEIVRLK